LRGTGGKRFDSRKKDIFYFFWGQAELI